MNDFFKYIAKNNILTSLKINALDKLNYLSNDQLLNRYNDRFQFIFKKAIKESPFYQNLYLKKYQIDPAQIKDLNDIQKLPIITKSEIRDHINEIYNSYDFLKVIGLTSGTSGTPLTLYRTIFDISTEQAYIRHYRKSLGFEFKKQPLLSLRGTLGKSTSFHHFKEANTLYLSTPNLNSSTVKQYYDLAKKFKPVAVEAFPSYLYKFCLELEKAGLQMKIPVAFTSSETLLDFQREKIEKFLQTKVYDWYGNAERSILLAQNNEMKYHPLPLYSINEYDTNHVITTNLINHRFPLIRYHVDDIITTQPKSFLDNITSPEIISIQGRVGDNVLLKDGSVVGCIDHAFKGVNHLEICQVHQYDVNEPIIVKIVALPQFSKSDEEQLRKNFIRMVGTEMELEFQFCKNEDLTMVPGKKFKLIINKRPS